MDHGIFSHAPSMFPSDLPVFKDEKFVKDREQYLGRTWSKESADKERPEALVEMKGAFMFLENTVLGDGREWILGEGKKGPSLADIEGTCVMFPVLAVKVDGEKRVGENDNEANVCGV